MLLALLVPISSALVVQVAVDGQYRPAAAMCVDAFHDMSGPFGRLKRSGAVDDWERALRSRCNSASSDNVLLTAMAEDAADAELLGCVECGLLPPPPERRDPEAPPPPSNGENRQQKPDVPYLANIVVAPSARRQGVGERLVVETEKLAQSWGFGELCIKVDRSNFNARRLYDRLGYEFAYLQTSKPDWNNKQTQFLFLRKHLEQ